MKKFRIKYPLPATGLDMDSFKFGLLMLGCKLKESIAGDTLITKEEINLGVLRTSARTLESNLPITMKRWSRQLFHQAYSLGLVTKMGNRQRLRCEHAEYGGHVLGTLENGKVDAIGIAFIIDSEGSIEIQAYNNRSYFKVESIVSQIGKQLGVRPDEEVIRELEVR